MKRLICFTLVILLVLCAGISAAAVETDVATGAATVEESSETVGEVRSEAIDETVGTEVTTEEVESAVIDESMSLSEAILAIAEVCGVSVEEAERMIGDIRAIGDKYLGESDLWVQITEDMEEHPAKWTLFGLLLATVFVLVGVLIKRVISDAMTTQRMKVALENIDKAIGGDEKDENGKALSIRAMINEKNGHIELLERENVELKAKAEELAKVIEALNAAISKVEANSDTSLKITEESALQILQLLNIALDRKVPITSKEARQIWYEHTQNNIKSIYEEGTKDGGEADEA